MSSTGTHSTDVVGLEGVGCRLSSPSRVEELKVGLVVNAWVKLSNVSDSARISTGVDMNTWDVTRKRMQTL